MKIGYARGSTKVQTVALQVDALKKTDCTKVHTEVTSGARSDRPISAEADVAYDVWWIGLSMEPRTTSRFTTSAGGWAPSPHPGMPNPYITACP
jgi:hypothetical protein